jgi:hypothetical protein
VYSTTATVTSPVGTYPISITGGLNSANYTLAFVNGTLTVSKGTPSVTLTSSQNPSTPTASVTFTAALSAGATGTVTFMGGTTALGTGTISGSSASFTVTALSVGTHPITAVYGGDANYNGNTSAVLSQVIQSVTTTPTADFSVTTTTGPQTIFAGTSATYNIVVASVNGVFPNAVALTATGLPAGATYTFQPASVTPTTAGVPSTFTVRVPQPIASRGPSKTPFVLAILLLPVAFLKRNQKRPTRLLLWLLFGLTSLGAISGCGSGGFYSHAQQTYTITVTGTSGTVAHSTTVTLTVQ